MIKMMTVSLIFIGISYSLSQDTSNSNANKGTSDFPYNSFNFKNFDFEEIAQEEWDLQENTEIGMKDAVILQEVWKYEEDGEIYDYIYYKRIKIFTQKGIDAATQEISYNKDDIIDIKFKGRTVLPGGTTIELSEKNVFSDIVVQKGDVQLSRKKIIFPGVQVGSIIELLMRQKTNYMSMEMKIQNTYYTKLSQFIIKPDFLFDWQLRNSQNLVPEIEFLPSRIKTNKVVFTMRDIPPFQAEELMPPEDEYKTTLQIYPHTFRFRYMLASMAYQGSNYFRISISQQLDGLSTFEFVPRSFWNDYSHIWKFFWRKFTDHSTLLSQIVQSTIQNESSNTAKLQELYTYVQQTFRIKSPKHLGNKKKKNSTIDNIDKLIKMKKGPDWMVNGLYAMLLRECGIPATTIELNDKDNIIFDKESFNINFSRTIVLADTGYHKYVFLSPASRFLPFGNLPWYIQNVTGVVSTYEQDRRPITSNPFIKTPRDSKPSLNIKMVSAKLTLNNNLSADLEVRESLKGQKNWLFKAINFEKSDSTLQEAYQKKLDAQWNNAKIISFKTENRDAVGTPCKINYSVHLANFITPIGDNLSIKPFILDKPIQQLPAVEKRKYPIWFHYVQKKVFSLRIILPDSYDVEYLPKIINVVNNQGSFTAKFEKLEKIINLTSILEIKDIEIPQNLYEKVKSITDAVHFAFDQELILVPNK